ncbi:hypothetical protein EDD21DRAFT_403471 [Dissophora ornata]|nr:hypothetical protein BGZ58_008752 [Dissophora ornata]KAI8602666.1 hypothetical protein EDD21DRAFT_403471 [Dissophora ornata]
MAITTRNKRATASTARNEAPAPKKATGKRTTKKAPVEPESESDQEVDKAEEESKDSQDESSDEDTFKIHTPKASAEPKIAPAVLPTTTYEDDSEEDDSDAAPEAESLSSAKAKVLSAQDKEKSFLTKVQAEQKAKRVEREEKLKAQKDQSKKKEQPKKTQAKASEPTQEIQDEETKSTTRSGLPTMLPMDILESVAQMEHDQSSSGAQGSLTTNDKKRKHMRPEDFALMELEAELKAEAQKRKKAQKTQKNVGPVTVKVLEQSTMAKGHTIPETIVDFRKQHFYGSKIQRKDAVLNLSQKNSGAASKFNRRK